MWLVCVAKVRRSKFASTKEQKEYDPSSLFPLLPLPLSPSLPPPNTQRKFKDLKTLILSLIKKIKP